MTGLLAVAAAALMAFAGTASATEITSSTGSTPTIHATSTNTELHSEAFPIACKHSTVVGTVTSHGAGVTAKGHISTLTFTECEYPVTVLANGTLEVHPDVNTGDGILTSTGAKVTIHGPFGINCTYETNATPIGTLTGSSTTGGHAVLDIVGGKIPRPGDSVFCGATGEWTGNYTVLHPEELDIH